LAESAGLAEFDEYSGWLNWPKPLNWRIGWMAESAEELNFLQAHRLALFYCVIEVCQSWTHLK